MRTRELPSTTSSDARWPDVTHVPTARVRTALVAGCYRSVAARMGVGVILPDGRRVGSRAADAPALHLRRPWATFNRFAVRGPIGLGEAYQAGDWDAEDLPALLTCLARHLDVPRIPRWLRRRFGPRSPKSTDNAPQHASTNIQYHYDLSNEMFAAFLDETMSYSSALFEVDAAGRPLADRARLVEAQRRKIERVLDLAWIGPGTRLLEIGTGWGELAVAAARRGAHVHSITLSQRQFEYVQQRVADEGFTGRITVEVCDYRDVRPFHADGYSAVVAVEMIEAVGEDYWPIFFGRIERYLAPGGIAVLQAITTDHQRLDATRGVYTWIQKYIFPGGRIPSVIGIRAVLDRYTGLRARDVQAFGAHYAATLRLWRENFVANADTVAALGFDETFRRTWLLYLAYCEAGFAAQIIDVHHLVLERPA